MPVRIANARYGGNFTSETGEEVPFVLPGEFVEGTEILEASSNRVLPRCPHFGTCGGCQYQHASYATQVALKTGILRGILAQARLSGLPEIQTHSAAEWGYRNRIRLRIESFPSPLPSFRSGYSRRSSNEFLPIQECPIAAPLLWRAAETMLKLDGIDKVRRTWLASMSEVELFCTGDESKLQMQLFIRNWPDIMRNEGQFGSFCESLRASLPELSGAGAVPDQNGSRANRRRWEPFAWGAGGLNYEVAGRSYWVSRGAFFQVNRFLVDRLVELVTGAASGAIAWDLFAGVGLFTRPLAEAFDHVVAVEAGDAAAGDLATASRKGKFEVVHASALDFLRARELQRERPEMIVLDPPRAGLGVEAATVLARIAAPRVVYVSCDPVTLARDLAVLTRGTYRIDTFHLVDLFPQTFHMETVVHLSRTSSR